MLEISVARDLVHGARRLTAKPVGGLQISIFEALF